MTPPSRANESSDIPSSHVLPTHESTEAMPIEAEILDVQRSAGANLMAVDDHASLPQMGPREQAVVKDRMIRKLQEAVDAESKVKALARLTDVYGADAVIGALVPALGDVATSVAYTIYLMRQANRAGLESADKKKIFFYQGLDVVAGLVPGADLISDFLVRGNSMSHKLFQKNVKKLIKEAREMGVSEDAIKEIQESVQTMEKEMGVVERIFR